MSLLSKKNFFTLSLIFALSLLQGCTVMYFHNGKPTEAFTSNEEPELDHYKTQHDGLVAMLEDNSVTLADTCTDGEWQTAKTENTLADIVIRLIANPVYGTSSVTFDCQQQNQIAQTN